MGIFLTDLRTFAGTNFFNSAFVVRLSGFPCWSQSSRGAKSIENFFSKTGSQWAHFHRKAPLAATMSHRGSDRGRDYGDRGDDYYDHRRRDDDDRDYGRERGRRSRSRSPQRDWRDRRREHYADDYGSGGPSKHRRPRELQPPSSSIILFGVPSTTTDAMVRGQPRSCRFRMHPQQLRGTFVMFLHGSM